MTSTVPFVSVVIPCRNEAPFIGACLDSVLASDYPSERLEILVVDGRSADGTGAIIRDYAARDARIKLLDNPKGITPAALNAAITVAQGSMILRMDAHALIDARYVSRSVEALQTYGADNVGGNMHTLPRQKSLLGWAIVSSLSHRFGVGNSHFRVHSTEPRWVDTVFGGCYRRDVFTRVGLFNEALARGQDMEFNLRLKKAGGRTLLVPDIVSYYYARAEYGSFCRHNWGNGVWAILPFFNSPIIPVSWRHLVPLAFVVAVCAMAVLGSFLPVAWWGLVAILGAYGVLSLLASADVAVQRRDLRYLLVMPVMFTSLHVAYGLGSLWGVISGVIRSRFLRPAGSTRARTASTEGK